MSLTTSAFTPSMAGLPFSLPTTVSVYVPVFVFCDNGLAMSLPVIVSVSLPVPGSMSG